jgi:RNase P subunit RPR2
MERRECQKCGVGTPHERVDLTEQAIDWTVFICSECGTMARARRAQLNLAETG